MPRKKKDEEWLKEVPAHLRPHLETPKKTARKEIGGMRPRPARNPTEAARFAEAVEQRIELMKKPWDTEALQEMALEVVVEDRHGGKPELIEWTGEDPDPYEIVDEGEEPPAQPTEEARLDAVDVDEACEVMLAASSYFEAAERLRLTIGELKRLRKRPKFHQIYLKRYEEAKASEPRKYAIQPFDYVEGPKAKEPGTGPLQLRMDEIILTLIQFPTVSEAAKKLGLKPSTLDHMRRDPRFQVRFHERRQEALALGTLILQMDYAKINLELLKLYFDPDTPTMVRANIGLQLSKRVEDQIEKEQANERAIQQLEKYKALLDKASQVTVDEVLALPEGE
jgi:hypothetical protein